jgi:hypothetical protein
LVTGGPFCRFSKKMTKATLKNFVPLAGKRKRRYSRVSRRMTRIETFIRVIRGIRGFPRVAFDQKAFGWHALQHPKCC